MDADLEPEAALAASVLLLHALPRWQVLANAEGQTIDERRFNTRQALERLAGPRVAEALQHPVLPDVIAQAFVLDGNERAVGSLMLQVLHVAFPRAGDNGPQVNAQIIPAEVNTAAERAYKWAHNRIATAYDIAEDGLPWRGLREERNTAARYLDSAAPYYGRLAGGGLAVLLGGAALGAVPLIIAGSELGGAAAITYTLSMLGGGAVAAGGGGMAAGVAATIGIAAAGAVLAVAGVGYVGHRAIVWYRRAPNLSAALEGYL